MSIYMLMQCIPQHKKGNKEDNLSRICNNLKIIRPCILPVLLINIFIAPKMFMSILTIITKFPMFMLP